MIVDSAVVWPNGNIYFFDGSQYYRYNIATERVDPGYPKPIQGNWPGLDPGVQGAIVWPVPVNGRVKAYFFKGSMYYTYNVVGDPLVPEGVEPGSPRPIAPNWRGVLGGSQMDHHIDVAVLWPSGAVYLFQEDHYYRYDVASDQVDTTGGYPLPIQGNWPGLGGSGQIYTAAFVWPKLVDGRQKAYFFHRTTYLRYDLANDAVDPGYPRPIHGSWSGL